MAFGKDSIIYLLSTILCTLTLAGSGNALRQRNINVGNQTAAAAATGVRLDINTDDLTNAGWALGVGAGGAAVGSLILFLYSLHLQPVDRFSRKIFFLSPLMLALNTLLMFAAAFPVTVFGRNNSATVKGYIGNTQLPDSVIKAASTIPVEYWSNAYVKFMVIVAWPGIPFAMISTFLAYKAWRKERPAAQHHHNNMESVHRNGVSDEKAQEIQHAERAY